MLDYQNIKKLAVDAGFDLCGIAPCRHLAQNEAWFTDWIASGYHSSLGYLERNSDKRFDPRKLVENAHTAVVCAVSYKNPVSEGYPDGCRTKIASYACTTDYHTTIRRMLSQLLATLLGAHSDLSGRAFVDTAPLAEKQLAVEAGLGWIGRQSLLITPTHGSFVLLGELILTLPTDRYDSPLTDVGCGTCRRCIEQCPTGAIFRDRMIDTSHCIACHTIEQEPSNRIDLNGWIFGCDACQSQCPYNRKAPQHTAAAFDPLFDPRTLNAADWQQMSPTKFEQMCGTTALTRSGLERIRRNISDPAYSAPDSPSHAD